MRDRSINAWLPLESQIDGDFEGWQGETVFRLINGQYWQQVSFSYVYQYAFAPAVQIVREGLGYRMYVAEVEPSILVRPIDVVVDSVVVGEFTGWVGETRFELANGQLWQQADDGCVDHYAYRPRALIYREGERYRLFVDGVGSTVAVRRIG